METNPRTHTIPLLAVPDVDAALSYYESEFGFGISGKMGSPTNYGIVERDGASIHFLLSRHPAANAAPLGGNVEDGKGGVYIEVPDVDQLARELKDRNSDRSVMPENKEYGMRDFWVRDLNGYLIAFGSRLLAGQST